MSICTGYFRQDVVIPVTYMLLVIESGIRGGLATISHRHAIANSEYMGTEFDPTKDSKFISYLDANNLYGWAISKQFPTSGFKWMIDNVDWKHLSCIQNNYTTFTMITT